MTKIQEGKTRTQVKSTGWDGPVPPPPPMRRQGCSPSLETLLAPLIQALQIQTEGLNRLAASNERIADAVVSLIEAEDAQDDGSEPATYLDGKPNH